MKLWALHNTK